MEPEIFQNRLKHIKSLLIMAKRIKLAKLSAFCLFTNYRESEEHSTPPNNPIPEKKKKNLLFHGMPSSYIFFSSFSPFSISWFFLYFSSLRSLLSVFSFFLKGSVKIRRGTKKKKKKAKGHQEKETWGVRGGGKGDIVQKKTSSPLNFLIADDSASSR